MKNILSSIGSGARPDISNMRKSSSLSVYHFPHLFFCVCLDVTSKQLLMYECPFPVPLQGHLMHINYDFLPFSDSHQVTGESEQTYTKRSFLHFHKTNSKV